MADFWQNLGPASNFLGTAINAVQHPIDTLTGMVKSAASQQPIPQELLDQNYKAAAAKAAETGLMAAFGAEAAPAMGARTLAPIVVQSVLGSMTHPQPGVLAGAATPDPEQAEVTAARVLAEAANKTKGKMGYSEWSATPGAGDAFGWDFQNPQPAMPERSGPIPRYVPPKGTKERMADALADPQVGKVLRAAVQNGKLIMPQNWYRTGPLYEVFQQELGDEAPAAYKRLMDIVAATSPKSSFPDNVRTASYYNHLDATGQPIPDVPAKGYGSVSQKNHISNVREVQAGGMDPMDHPKPVSFSENLLGNEVPETIDTHKMRLIGMASKDPRFLETSVRTPVGKGPDGKDIYVQVKPRQMYEQGKITMEDALKEPTWWVSAPESNEYGAAEAYTQKMAGKMGLSTADVQGKQWVGAGGIPGYPKVPGMPEGGTGLGSPPETALRMIAKRIQYTAYRLGADPQVVLQKFVKGEIPLLGLGAGAIAVGTQRSDQDSR